MKIRSFVEQSRSLDVAAVVYIRETIKREGEVSVSEDDYLCVPCHDPYTGDLFNLVVKTIKEDSIVGYCDEYGEDYEVAHTEWEDGTSFWVADCVAKTYGEL